MTSRPRFPFGLTVAAAVVFAVCCALGVWQLQRLDWKTQQLARIAALQHAPPQPIGPVLARAAASGKDAGFTRVAAACLADTPAPAMPRMTSDNGEWITRALSFCRLSGATYEGVWVDRGFVEASRGATTTLKLTLPTPVKVVGVLSHIRGDCFGSDGCSYWFANILNSAPYVLVANSEAPPAPGVTPAPYANAADNLQYVGAYWLTWFGLAGAVACVYAAMLWRRTHPKPVPSR